MIKAFSGLLVLVVAGCTSLPAAPTPQQGQQAQYACAQGGESSYGCQVERYNAIGSQ